MCARKNLTEEKAWHSKTMKNRGEKKTRMKRLQCVYKELICNLVFVETFLVCLVAETELETCKPCKCHLPLKAKA
jgi:hypothetical protein